MYNQKINDYTQEGRALIHKRQELVSSYELMYLVQNPVINESIEYNDNRISKYVAQKGKCAVTKARLKPWEIHCHHIKPRSLEGTDVYSNLLIVCNDVHKLIHATKQETIQDYLNKLSLNKTQIAKLNELRVKAGNQAI